MSRPQAPADARRLLQSRGLRPKKSWGQNFLQDQRVLLAITEALERGPGDAVVELGAGTGALTRYLLQRGPVTAVERDRELVPILRETFTDQPLTILEADAARVSYEDLAAVLGGALLVAGNLPYQISSRILVELADAREHVARAVLLLQREVAERLCAAPGGREYGLLSVLVRRAFDIEILRDVPPGAFYPPPKVHSSVVRLRRAARPWEAVWDAALVAAARAAFSARRKTVRNSLRNALGCHPEALAAALAAASVDGQARPETLDLPDLARLGRALAEHGLL